MTKNFDRNCQCPVYERRHRNATILAAGKSRLFGNFGFFSESQYPNRCFLARVAKMNPDTADKGTAIAVAVWRANSEATSATSQNSVLNENWKCLIPDILTSLEFAQRLLFCPFE